jgi:predicted ATPase
MEIKSLRIQGFKSLVDVTLHEPEPFTVFVGPNAAGKSNFFEALEFLKLSSRGDYRPIWDLLGDGGIFNEKFRDEHGNSRAYFEIASNEISVYQSLIRLNNGKWGGSNGTQFDRLSDIESKDLQALITGQSAEDFKESYWPFYGVFKTRRVFIGNTGIKKINVISEAEVALDASNLEPVLKRILQNENHRQEITELLQLLIPGFDRVEIAVEPLSGSFNLLIYEEGMDKPLNRHLISDGTYNILALIAAVYQSDQPQFLCIEEPENGLNPMVIKQLVKFFRQKCEEKGHYIWLNTHSQSLVAELQPGEIVLVDKKNGATQFKQIPKDFNLHGLRMDEALLTNALGGGIPW